MMTTKRAVLIGFALGVGVAAAVFVVCSLLFVDPHWDTAAGRGHPKGGSVTMDRRYLVTTSTPAAP
jgi:hypothetical protein